MINVRILMYVYIYILLCVLNEDQSGVIRSAPYFNNCIVLKLRLYTFSCAQPHSSFIKSSYSVDFTTILCASF